MVFAALASDFDRVVLQMVSTKGGGSPFLTETMIRILVLKRLQNLSDEQVEFQLLDLRPIAVNPKIPGLV